MRRRTVIISALAVVAVVAAVAGALLASSGGSGSGGRSSASGHLLAGGQHPRMCGLRTTPGTYQHVLVLFEENHSYASIYGSSSAPFINSLASKCGLATNYHNITHPSLPNYIGATTGAQLLGLERYTPDCAPSLLCQWSGENIFNQLNRRHRRWKVFAEAMPHPCDKSNAGPYAPRHNPAVYDTDLGNCSANDVPLGSLASSRLFRALSSSSRAPAFTWITPNLCHDMHGTSGCPPNLIRAGDRWLHAWLTRIISTPVYRAGHTVVLISWDEGEPGTEGESCANNTSDQSCHVVTIVVAPSVKPGTRVHRLLNHYSLLKTAESLLGLPKLGQAATAASMVTPFNL